MLPTRQPAHELRRSYRLDLLAKLAESEAMNARQEAAFAPFGFVVNGISELSSQDDSTGFQMEQRSVNVRFGDPQNSGKLACEYWASVGHPARNRGELGFLVR